MSSMPVGISGGCPLNDLTSTVGPLSAGLRCFGAEGRHSIYVLGSTWIIHLSGSVRATASLAVAGHCKLPDLAGGSQHLQTSAVVLRLP